MYYIKLCLSTKKVDNIEKPIKIGYSFVKKSSFTFLSISSITLVSVFSLRSSQLSSLSDTSILTLESPTSSTPSSFSILYSMLLSFISTLVHAGSFKLLTIISVLLVSSFASLSCKFNNSS